MNYLVTPEFYSIAKQIKQNHNLKPSKASTFRKLHAFACKYKVISKKQAEVLNDIGSSVGIELLSTLEPIGKDNAMV